ncbi:GNAT family N-acetyltransferase [Corticicoccus populi]|uniref:GNAT family N-acetyltransferase n=1 Tax=Corticicoccus populi TaxID=1812821 RepID=A0ABW5WYQ3_9STAP
MYNFKHDIVPELPDLKYLYTENMDEAELKNRFDAVTSSDYCVTAWDNDSLIGMIRSSGDQNYLQVITDFLVHDDYQSQGISSRLIRTYFSLTPDVREYLLVSKSRFQNTYMITWLEHKGFLLRSKEDGMYIFHKKK